MHNEGHTKDTFYVVPVTLPNRAAVLPEEGRGVKKAWIPIPSTDVALYYLSVFSVRQKG